MKLDVTQVINRLDEPDKPLLTAPARKADGEPNPASKPLTLRAVLVESLLAPHPNDEKLEQAKRLKRWQLAKRIQRDDLVEMTLTEAATCQRLIGRRYGLNVLGPAVDMLEAAGTPVEVADEDPESEEG